MSHYAARAARETTRISRLAANALFDLKCLRDGQLSPDGKRVAYAVSSTDQDTESFGIHVVELDGGDVRRLPAVGNATSPRWSPDGHWLAFALDGRLRVAAAASLDVSDPLTPDGVNAQGAPCWSPDSRRLAVSLMSRPMSSGPRRIVTKHFRSEGLGFTEGLVQQIWIVDRVGGALRQLTHDGFCSQPEWSPCGGSILSMASDSAVPFSSYSPRLQLVDVNDGSVRTLLDDRWFVTAARWLPNGDRIAVAAAFDSTLTAPNPALWVINLQGHAEARTPGITAKISGLIHHDLPAWDLMQSNPIVVLDDSTAFVTVLNRGSMEIWRVALSGATSIDRVLTGERSYIALDINRKAGALLYAVTSLHSPPELWRASLEGTHEKQLSDLNGQVLAGWPAMRVEAFTCTSNDGLKMDAWFMAAAGRAGPLPTILFIHGGPFASTGHAFRYDFHLLASHGFGVVFANFRGSAGYGDAFTRGIMGGWGSRGFPDHMCTIDAAIARGYADASRLGVWGPSHGGYATCWVVGHTSRFKAAVAEAASTNFTTSYYLMDGPDVIARDLGGRPHEIPDVYRAASPITYAHQCTTPTMFVHGELDLRCPLSEAEQFYRVLQDVGCLAELVCIPDCDHLGDSCGPLSARRAQNEALLRWFQCHV